MQSEYLTVDKAATLIGFSHWTIRRWLSGSRPRLTRYKSGSRVVVNRAELLGLVRPARAKFESDRLERK